MTVEEVTVLVPAIKSLSELGLGILGTLTTIGISIYFVASLAPLLKKLTLAVESVVETNKSVVTTMQSISNTLNVHEQRSLSIEANIEYCADQVEDIKMAVTKICGKIGC